MTNTASRLPVERPNQSHNLSAASSLDMALTDAMLNLWWVVPQQLGGMAKPAATTIPHLRTVGIDAVVSVTDDPGNLAEYVAANIPHCWLPIAGGTAPTLDQVKQFQQFMADHHGLGHSVVVHCSSGRRRTGTLLAAYLIATGQSAEAAMSTIHRANPAVELRAAQIEFLRTLALSWEGR